MAEGGDALTEAQAGQDGATGAPVSSAPGCVLCGLDYPTLPVACAHRVHLMQEGIVTFCYQCPVAWAHLPEAVFLVEGLPVLPIPVCALE